MMIQSIVVAFLFAFSAMSYAHELKDSLTYRDLTRTLRLTLNRPKESSSAIVHYLSLPDTKTFPICILCGGSTDKNSPVSMLTFHEYFMQELVTLGLGVLTVELWGIDGLDIHHTEFIKHYTRTQRLRDHQAVIDYYKKNPINGWNGQLVFLGVSEGGPLVTSLSTQYVDETIATINWSGAGDLPWREELWTFLEKYQQENLECPHKMPIKQCVRCAHSRQQYDMHMNLIWRHPTSEREFLNMTYLYHADAMQYPQPMYYQLKKPYLVVTGELDSLIESSDAFVQKALACSAPITYFRVPDMDHFIRKRPDMQKASFDWLALQLKNVGSSALQD